MRFVLFFIFLFVTDGCLLGAPVKIPFPNFGAAIIVWVVYYLITLPGRRRRAILARPQTPRRPMHA